MTLPIRHVLTFFISLFQLYYFHECFQIISLEVIQLCLSSSQHESHTQSLSSHSCFEKTLLLKDLAIFTRLTFTIFITDSFNVFTLNRSTRDYIYIIHHEVYIHYHHKCFQIELPLANLVVFIFFPLSKRSYTHIINSFKQSCLLASLFSYLPQPS